MTTASLVTNCALCHQPRQLQESHIIPRFVGAWLKSTSATGYLRRPSEPNLRVQDLHKVHLLCDTCEKRLGVWENQFAKDIFLPFQEQRAHGQTKLSFTYGEWFRRFAVSLAWRVAVTEAPDFRQHSASWIPFLDKALETWRLYLLKDNFGPGAFEQHVIFLDKLESVQSMEVPPHLHTYMLRATDESIVTGSTVLGVYTKLPAMAFFAAVQPVQVAGWKGTRIDRSGTIGTPQSIKQVKFNMGEFLFHRARLATDGMAGISEAQQKAIEKQLAKNPNRVRDSLTVEAMRTDEAWRDK